jgi:hypothetical protein
MDLEPLPLSPIPYGHQCHLLIEIIVRRQYWLSNARRGRYL